jgi:hypothetical protein
VLVGCAWYEGSQKKKLIPSTAMTQEQRREHEAFLDVSGGFEDDSGGYEGDVLRGTTAAEISHAGEAIQDPEEDRADDDLLEML